jgi:signal peptidase I
MSSSKRFESLHRTNSTQRTLISELREEIEGWSIKYEQSEERRDSLQEALGEEKSKSVEDIEHAKQVKAEVEERNEKLDEEVIDLLRPLQGKYSDSETELKETKEALESKTEEFSELESNYTTLESQLIEERAKNTDDLTETHPELMPLLEFLHEKNKEYVDAKTQYESNLEEVVGKFKRTKPHKTMRYFKIIRESDGEIMTNKDDFSFTYKNIIEGLIDEVEWSKFDEYVDRVRSDFDEAIEYMDWAKKISNFNQKQHQQFQKIVRSMEQVGNSLYFKSLRKKKRASKELCKTDAEKDKLIQDCPITNERFNQIFQIEGISMEPVEWIHLREPQLQIHDKLDEKTYTQLRESYMHIKEKENISVFALENIVNIRNRFLNE